MKSLKDLNSRIRQELKINEADGDEESMDTDVDRDDAADGVIMRINNETKMNANVKNLEFEVYYADLARTLTDDERVPFTFTKKKAKATFEIILEEIGFFVSVESGAEEDVAMGDDEDSEFDETEFDSDESDE